MQNRVESTQIHMNPCCQKLGQICAFSLAHKSGKIPEMLVTFHLKRMQAVHPLGTVEAMPYVTAHFRIHPVFYPLCPNFFGFVKSSVHLLINSQDK